MTTIKISAQNREEIGSKTSIKLRQSGSIPAIVLCHGKNINISTNEKEILSLVSKYTALNSLVELDINGKKINTIVKEVQFHPITDKVLHVDFLEVIKGKEVEVNVPINFLGRDNCVGIKKGGRIHVISYHIPLRCSADNIPEHIDIDISKLDMGSIVRSDSKIVTLPQGTKAVKTVDIITVSGKSSKEEAEDAATTPAATPAPAAKA